jgi:hypothetical protein
VAKPSSHRLRRKGQLNKRTKVFLPRIASGPDFCVHPIFLRIPNVTLRPIQQNLFKILRRLLRSEIEPLVNVQSHLNANEGIQLGMSVVSGGKKRNTIQWGMFMKTRPELRLRLCNVLGQILHTTFGKCRWYQRLVRVTNELARNTGEQRTLPGLPCSGIWYTLSTKNNGIHCDSNVVGSSFIMSMEKVNGGHLNLQLPSGNFSKERIEPEYCLAGRWSENAHCNTDVDENTRRRRRSIILYLDRAVFSAAYKYNIPNGFLP